MGRPSLNAIVSRNIRSLRMRAGLSQEALADQCALHRTYIGAIERGERNITLRTLERIAAALRIAPARLLSERRS